MLPGKEVPALSSTLLCLQALPQGCPWPLSKGGIPPFSPALQPPLPSCARTAQPALDTKGSRAILGETNTRPTGPAHISAFPVTFSSSLSPPGNSCAADAPSSCHLCLRRPGGWEELAGPCVHSWDGGKRVVPFHPDCSTPFTTCSGEKKEQRAACLPQSAKVSTDMRQVLFLLPEKLPPAEGKEKEQKNQVLKLNCSVSVPKIHFAA